MSNAKPRISIIFPSYNGAKFLKRNLESIKSLKNLKEIELVIVDNMSRDSSINVIKTYEKDINIKLLRNYYNQGFAEACNSGVNDSMGEFIFITNQDVIFPSDFFDKLTTIYSNLKNKHEIAISPAIVFENGRIHYFGAKNHYLGFSYTPELGEKLPKKKIIRSTSRLSGGCLFIKKDFFLKMGGFDKDFFMYYEDTDLSLKMIRNGNKIYTTNDPCLIHQKDHQSLNELQYFFLERNRFFVIAKNILDTRKIIPIILIVECILLVHSIFIKKFKIRLKIYLELMRRVKYFREIRNKEKSKNHLLSIQSFSKKLDPILLGNLQNLKVFRIILRILNRILGIV